MKKVQRTWLGAAIGGVLSVLLGLVVWIDEFHPFLPIPVGQLLSQRSYDIPFRSRASSVITNAFIIYLDDASHGILNQRHGQWDRRLYAQLIKRLHGDGAKAIVMDILFTDASEDPSHDAELAQAFGQAGNVIIGTEFKPGDQREYPPTPALAESAARVASINFVPDADDAARLLLSHVHVPESDSHRRLATLGWATAEWVLGEARTVLGDPERRTRYLNYYGPPGQIPSISFHLALSTNDVPADHFADQIVFIGQTNMVQFAGAAKDTVRTPYSAFGANPSSGVELHATAALNLLNQEWLVRANELLVLIVLGAAFGVGLSRLRPLPATITSIGAIIIVGTVAGIIAMQAQVWFSWMLVTAIQIPTACVSSIIYNSFIVYGEKRALERSLSLHLSPTRVKQIQKRPELLQPGAEEQEITILFSDIANFSRITGRMDPEDLFKMLNQYFETTLECIHQHDGTVIKLIGDAIFAIWNAPFVQPDQQEKACRAAIDLQSKLVQFDVKQRSLPLNTRVGLHTGHAFVGNVGSSTRFDYTAIGDPVNLASRLEGLNKYLGTDILATRETQKIVENTIDTRLVGHFRLLGIDRIIEVHEILGARQDEADRPEVLETFSQALYDFQRQSWDKAVLGFKNALQQSPEDGPSQFYLDQIQRLRTQGVPSGWTGEVSIEGK